MTNKQTVFIIDADEGLEVFTVGVVWEGAIIKLTRFEHLAAVTDSDWVQK